MTSNVPVIVRQRAIDDDELRQMLLDAVSNGDSEKFFEKFEYHAPGDPFRTIIFGEAMLKRCVRVAPQEYQKLHKGTPFYWLARAAYLTHDYETATFYIDAAVSEDIKITLPDKSPALSFFLVDEDNPEQASLELVRSLRAKIDASITDYNQRTGASTAKQTFSEFQTHFLRRAIAPGNEHLRTLATTFNSFALERSHRNELLNLTSTPGTAEPFFIHLFKGCVLFESILKHNPRKVPTQDTLGKVLQELHSDLMIPSNIKSWEPDFANILNGLKANDPIASVIERVTQIRNTLGHNLGWPNRLNAQNYNILANDITCACLHSIACLYR